MSDNQPQENQYEQYLSAEARNVAKLTLAFAKAVGARQSDKNDNLVVSPYNALSCLSMVAKGASAETREELAQSLFGTDAAQLDSSIDALAKLNNDMLAANEGKTEVKTANGVWANSALLNLDSGYADDLKKTFGAEISTEAFTPATVDKINSWASDNTNKLIEKVLEELNPDDFAVLASSLYFKGEWTTKFDKADTKDKYFRADGSNLQETATMQKHFTDEEAAYRKGSDYQAVCLTYGKKDIENNDYPSMRVVLIRPDNDSISARDWLAQQANGTVPDWLSPYGYRGTEGDVALPRIDIKQNHDLIEPLKDLGIKAAFDGAAADFSRMTEERAKGLYLSKVSHDIVFKTDEEGSEAAAVTTAVFTLECARMPQQPFNVKFDRSFVFAVQDIETNAVLFIGAVNKPNDDMKPAKTICPKF